MATAATACPPFSQYAAYNALASHDKELTVYPDFAHESAPGWNDKIYAWLPEMGEERKNENE